MGQAVEGVYHGYYRVIYENPEGKLGITDSIPASIRVTGWNEREITFYDCPIALYAKAYDEDNPLWHIFGNQSNMDFTSNYLFRRWGEVSEEIAFGHQLPTSISLTGDYEGVTHHVRLNFSKSSSYLVSFQKEDFARSEILRGREIRLEINNIIDGEEVFYPLFYIMFYANE